MSLLPIGLTSPYLTQNRGMELSLTRQDRRRRSSCFQTSAFFERIETHEDVVVPGHDPLKLPIVRRQNLSDVIPAAVCLNLIRSHIPSARDREVAAGHGHDRFPGTQQSPLDLPISDAVFFQIDQRQQINRFLPRRGIVDGVRSGCLHGRREIGVGNELDFQVIEIGDANALRILETNLVARRLH